MKLLCLIGIHKWNCKKGIQIPNQQEHERECTRCGLFQFLQSWGNTIIKFNISYRKDREARSDGD